MVSSNVGRIGTPEWLPGVREAVKGDEFWGTYLARTLQTASELSVHLAIFVPPYLEYVLCGKKTVESRFSSVRCAPFGRVQEGDVILLKRSGGAVVGLATAARIWSYTLDPNSWSEIRKEFTDALCAQDPEFWSTRKEATYATLVRLQNVRRIPPMGFPKRDRRGWVVLREGKERRS